MVDQKVGTIRLAKALLAELEAAPDQVNNDHGASFVAVFAAVDKFITSLDGAADDDSPFILGDPTWRGCSTNSLNGAGSQASWGM
jgi:hypothetical protein